MVTTPLTEAPTRQQRQDADSARLPPPVADEVVKSASKAAYAEADEAELRDWIESRGVAVTSRPQKEKVPVRMTA